MILRVILIITHLIFFFWPASAQDSTEVLLKILSQTINDNEKYITEKQSRINQLQEVLKEKGLSAAVQFNIYDRLHHEFRTFKYDSAFTYALKLQELAKELNDPNKEAYAKLRLGHTLLTSGMYKEALDSLNTINSGVLSDSLKADYYALMARTFYDLSGYTSDPYYSPKYIQTGEAYADSALSLIDKNTLFFHAIRGMKNEVSMKPDAAREDFEAIIEDYNPTLNQYAMAANSLGNIYYNKGKVEEGINMLAKAAIADIKASVKEGVALMTLADILYHHGEEKIAYEYIKQALEDADFYGAKQRKIQIGAILPVIEGERLATVESQRQRLLTYSIAVSILSLLVVVFAFIIFKQLKQIRRAKRTVTEANEELSDANHKLQETNIILQKTNDKLVEANKIKEGYIGHSFNMYNHYLEKIDTLKKAIHRKLMSRKYDEINHVMDSINLKKERDDLNQGFDKIFLRLFPDFIPQFNLFFKEEDRFILKDNESLNIELRIFALIRLGIHDHEQIASILEYSIRTIYNYKTKVKNKSILSNEEFERRLMEIKAF